MINKKNKPAFGLNINQFVENTRQNRRTDSVTDQIRTDADNGSRVEGTSVVQEKPDEKVVSDEQNLILEEVPSAAVTEDDSPSDTDNESEVAPSDSTEEKPKRKRTVQQKAVKRDKLVAIRFDKKMHKDISRIKLDYEIDIQDFVYVAVEKFKEEFFPGGKATKEGIEFMKQALERINGKKSEES